MSLNKHGGRKDIQADHVSVVEFLPPPRPAIILLHVMLEAAVLERDLLPAPRAFATTFLCQ